MIDEAGGVALHTGVDHRLAVDDEQKSVVVVRIVILVTLVGFLVRDALTEIFDHPRALGDALRGKNAPAMDAGIADFDPCAGAHFGYRHDRLLQTATGARMAGWCW